MFIFTQTEESQPRYLINLDAMEDMWANRRGTGWVVSITMSNKSSRTIAKCATDEEAQLLLADIIRAISDSQQVIDMDLLIQLRQRKSPVDYSRQEAVVSR